MEIHSSYIYAFSILLQIWHQEQHLRLHLSLMTFKTRLYPSSRCFVCLIVLVFLDQPPCLHFTKLDPK